MSSHLHNVSASFAVTQGVCVGATLCPSVLPSSEFFCRCAHFPHSWQLNVLENLWCNESQPGVTFSTVGICISTLFSEQHNTDSLFFSALHFYSVLLKMKGETYSGWAKYKWIQGLCLFIEEAQLIIIIMCCFFPTLLQIKGYVMQSKFKNVGV